MCNVVGIYDRIFCTSSFQQLRAPDADRFRCFKPKLDRPAKLGRDKRDGHAAMINGCARLDRVQACADLEAGGADRFANLITARQIQLNLFPDTSR